MAAGWAWRTFSLIVPHTIGRSRWANRSGQLCRRRWRLHAGDAMTRGIFLWLCTWRLAAALLVAPRRHIWIFIIMLLHSCKNCSRGLTLAKAVGHRSIFAMLLVNNEFILDKKTNQEEYKRFCLPDEYATCIHDPNPNRLQLLAVAVISLRRRWQKNTLDDAEPPSPAGDGSVA